MTENVFRAVNIALVNELKVIFHAMGIDIFEVIEAAKTKPFGFMPFYPGPGLGGHCIPVDPFYLTWRAREFGIATKFIELAGEINTAMPQYVVERLRLELDRRFRKGLHRYDAAVIVTDHSSIHQEALLQAAPLVVDTRNVVPRSSPFAHVVARA